MLGEKEYYVETVNPSKLEKFVKVDRENESYISKWSKRRIETKAHKKGK